MNRLKRFMVAATMSAGLLVQAAIVPTTLMRPVLAAAPATPAATAPAAAPAEQPVQTPQANGKVIFIDVGHGGSETGTSHVDASGKADVVEKDVNLSIAEKLADMLRQQGYTVVIDRTTDARPAPGGSLAADLQARVDQANSAHADLFVSIHNNGSDNHSTSGTEVYYCADRPFSADSARLAKLVDQGIVGNLKQAGYNVTDRGVRDEGSMGHFAVLAPSNLDHASNMPGILGEPLYLTNDQDAAQIKQPQIQAAIAHGYLDGINAYFGIGQSQAQS